MEQGIAPKAVANERGALQAAAFPALESGIKDRDGVWHNLSIYEKDGQLTGTLQRRDVQTGDYEKAPVVFEPDGKGGLAALAAYDGGEKLTVSLSRSEPTLGGHEKVDVRVSSGDQQIHEHPGRLRANDALQKIPDHREGKAIEQALGVDPKMLNPVPTREAQRAPAKAQEKQHSQGVQL
ncbi:hypothetical protein Lferr_0237 [Acidithiobacillus ferrooxidans ATCC 53993]|nr:hypothetical protein Lferr_0237 [Acidithiobacillus ferrooxidans ATCC 53993]